MLVDNHTSGNTYDASRSLSAHGIRLAYQRMLTPMSNIKRHYEPITDAVGHQALLGEKRTMGRPKRTLSGVAAAFAGGLLLAGSGGAAAGPEVIIFNLLDAQWSGAEGGKVTFLDPTPPAYDDPALIRWGNGGVDLLNTDSGYDFDARDPVPFTEPGGIPFVLGEFTHQNFPISSGNAIETVTLGILADVFCGVCDEDFTGVTFSFDFLHDETPNEPPGFPTTCAPIPEDTLIVGDNSQGCGDFVEIVSSADNPIIGGSTLKILGFTDTPDDPTNFFSNFFSGEGERNPATLIATFTSPVPSPAPMALLGLGLAGIAALRRKGQGRK